MKPEDVSELRLGDRITFNGRIFRRRTLEKRTRYGHDHDCWVKRWTRERWAGDTGPHPIEQGMLVGVRTLSNGLVEYDPEIGGTFAAEEHFTALLVVTGLRRKPVLVLPEDAWKVDPAVLTEGVPDANQLELPIGDPAA